MLEILLAAIVLGSAAAGFALAVRALPGIRSWVDAGIKPWACDICLGFWSTLFVALVYWFFSTDIVLAAVGPAYPVCLSVIRVLTQPRGAPMFPVEDD